MTCSPARYPRPTQNVDHSLAARRIEREDREAYRAACRQIDEAVSDIIRIAERAKAAIENCAPSDTEPFEGIPFQ